MAAFWHEYREWYFKIAITISWANRRGRFVAIRKLLELYICRIAHANHAVTPGFHIIVRNSTLSCRRSYAIWNDRGDCKEKARSWGAPNRAIIWRQGFVWSYDYLVNWKKGHVGIWKCSWNNTALSRLDYRNFPGRIIIIVIFIIIIFSHGYFLVTLVQLLTFYRLFPLYALQAEKLRHKKVCPSYRWNSVVVLFSNYCWQKIFPMC